MKNEPTLDLPGVSFRIYAKLKTLRNSRLLKGAKNIHILVMRLCDANYWQLLFNFCVTIKKRRVGRLFVKNIFSTHISCYWCETFTTFPDAETKDRGAFVSVTNCEETHNHVNNEQQMHDGENVMEVNQLSSNALHILNALRLQASRTNSNWAIYCLNIDMANVWIATIVDFFKFAFE